MMVGLDEVTQADWSGGMCRAVARHHIPEDAAYDIRDGLLDDDGTVYQRGATTRITSGQLSSGGIAALWEAQLTPGRRLLGVGATQMGVLNAAGTAWVTLSGTISSGITGAGLSAVLGELMFFPLVIAGTPVVIGYGGSQKTLIGATSSASVTNGSATVTGAGTTWLAGTDAGMLFYVGGVTAVIKSVDSNTQITLTAPWLGPTNAAATYVLLQTQSITGGLAQSVATCQGRVLASLGRVVKLSNTIDQNTGRTRPWNYDADDFHEFPADVVGMATLRDTVYVFTKAGIWSIQNVGLPIVDALGNPQHRVQQVSGDVVLRSPGGLAPWRDSMVVCAVDGIYVMDAAGGLELISRSITPLWQSYMAAGAQVYQAETFRDHMFVRVGSEMVIGRLDRRTTTPVGKSAPWTRSTVGELPLCQALAVMDPYGTPKLVGGTSALGYLLDLTGVFRSALPAATGGTTDANGNAVSSLIETREYVIDAGSVGTVKDVAVEYESTDGALAVSAAIGQRATPAANPTYTALASTAAGNYATQNPRVISVLREARRVSFQISSTGGGVSGWKLRAVRLRSRLRGRRR